MSRYYPWVAFDIRCVIFPKSRLAVIPAVYSLSYLAISYNVEFILNTATQFSYNANKCATSFPYLWWTVYLFLLSVSLSKWGISSIINALLWRYSIDNANGIGFIFDLNYYANPKRSIDRNRLPPVSAYCADSLKYLSLLKFNSIAVYILFLYY